MFKPLAKSQQKDDIKTNVVDATAIDIGPIRRKEDIDVVYYNFMCNFPAKNRQK